VTTVPCVCTLTTVTTVPCVCTLTTVTTVPCVCTELRSDCCETAQTAVHLSASPTIHTDRGMSAAMPTCSETPPLPMLQCNNNNKQEAQLSAEKVCI